MANPLDGLRDHLEEDRGSRYEARIVKYILGRYGATRTQQNQIKDLATQQFGVPFPTMAIVERIITLPVILRPQVLYHMDRSVTLSRLMNGKALKGQLGQQYRDLLNTYCEEFIDDICIAMCFNMQGLDVPGSANSLVIHNSGLTPEDVVRTNGGVICCAGDNGQIWTVEPLKFLLDRYDERTEDE